MTEHSVKIETSDLVELRRILLRNKDVAEIRTTNEYERFRMMTGNGFIIGYESGKIVATDEVAKSLLTNAILKLRSPDYDVIIGSDEAGKGEWLGPLVIVAVALIPAQNSILRAAGIMDSKELSTRRIIELSDIVERTCDNFKRVLIPPTKFNERIAELKREQKTLNDLMAWGHAKAIETVYSSFKGKSLKVRVVIDEFDKLKTENRLQRWLNLKEFELVQKPRAEEEIAVAAASIIARAEWERWVDQTSQKYEIELRKLTPLQMLNLGSAAKQFAKINYIKK